MWFNEKDIIKHEPFFLDNLHGYVLPHAGTEYTGDILSHTLRFRPKKHFKNILIIYLPSQDKPNVEEYYHEYYVPFKTLEIFYPDKKFIGYNMLLKNNPKIDKLNNHNTLFVISADFSHHLEMGQAIELENCAAHSIMHKSFHNVCTNVIDDMRSFKRMNKVLPNISYQWIGRTRSPGLKGVGYLSFLMRNKPNVNKHKPDAFFVTAYDKEMRQRECLGNTNEWTHRLERELIQKVINLAGKTSRLTGGEFIHVPVTNYTVTYLYKDISKDFIRGKHAILKDALYLPDVFLENTYDNGEWITTVDKVWSSGKFKLEPTFLKLGEKAGVMNSRTDYQLYYSEVIHKKVIHRYIKRITKRRRRTRRRRRSR